MFYSRNLGQLKIKIQHGTDKTENNVLNKFIHVIWISVMLTALIGGAHGATVIVVGN